jgi:hypothetical protein
VYWWLRQADVDADPALPYLRRSASPAASQVLEPVTTMGATDDPKDRAYLEECRRQSAIIAKEASDPTSEEAQMNRELEAWAAELDANELPYDWGPEGPPK